VKDLAYKEKKREKFRQTLKAKRTIRFHISMEQSQPSRSAGRFIFPQISDCAMMASQAQHHSGQAAF